MSTETFTVSVDRPFNSTDKDITHKKQENEEDFLVRLDRKLEKRIEDIKSEKTIPVYTVDEQDQEYINTIDHKFDNINTLMYIGREIQNDKLFDFKEVERYLVLTNKIPIGYTNYIKHVMDQLNSGDRSIFDKD